MTPSLNDVARNVRREIIQIVEACRFAGHPELIGEYLNAEASIDTVRADLQRRHDATATVRNVGRPVRQVSAGGFDLAGIEQAARSAGRLH